MADNKLYDIKTGQPVKTNERQKRGQDAKRWRYLLGMIKRGEATLLVGGNEMNGDLLKGTIKYIDDNIDDEYRAMKREEAKKRRMREK